MFPVFRIFRGQQQDHLFQYCVADYRSGNDRSSTEQQAGQVGGHEVN